MASRISSQWNFRSGYRDFLGWTWFTKQRTRQATYV